MKKKLVFMVLFAVFAASSLFAQKRELPRSAASKQSENIDVRVQRLSALLSLDDHQKVALKNIYLAQKEDKGAAIEKQKMLQVEERNAISNLLTPEQKVIFEAKKNESEHPGAPKREQRFARRDRVKVDKKMLMARRHERGFYAPVAKSGDIAKQQTARLTKRLGLDEKQQKEIYDVLLASKNKLWKQTQAQKEVNQAHVQKVYSLLTKEQKEKYKRFSPRVYQRGRGERQRPTDREIDDSAFNTSPYRS